MGIGVLTRIASSIAAALCLSAALAPRVAAENKYALLIGIQTYQPKGTQIKRPAAAGSKASGQSRWDLPVWPNLDGSLNDVRSMHELLASPKFGFPEKNIHVVTEAQATRSAILAAMQKYLVDEPQRGDIVVFYYAGHGSQRLNSKNGTPDHLDETIVPVDANTGVFDVRNKEIARLFNRVVDKGALLTAIFDSCHSGAVARGIPVGAPGHARFLPYDPRDAADPPDRSPGGGRAPTPEERPGGAVVLSAAQQDQFASEWTLDDGTSHGAFTVALMDTLDRLPADASAEEVYGRVKVLMQGMGLNAEQPALDAPPDRRQAALFGNTRANGKLRLAAGPEGVRPDGTLALDGGRSLGLGPGCELVRVKSKPTDPDVRVQIVRAELGSSTAKLLPPATRKEVEPGDEFELDKWVAPAAGGLQVWLPPTLPAAEIARVAAEISKVRDAAGVTWVDDPIKTSPTHTLQWNGTAWVLQGPQGESQDLGRQPTAAAVTAKITAGTAKPRLFLYLPPSPEVADSLRAKLSSGKMAVAILPKPETVQYLLVGRAENGGVEYAWMQKNFSLNSADVGEQASEDGTLCSPASPYPPRTNWFPATSADQASDSLADYAGRLARVQGWLQLSAPTAGAGDAFPYRLAMRRLSAAPGRAAGEILTHGPVVDGESYGLVLQATGAIPDYFKPRWVYVLGIACDGSGKLLYPLSGQNNYQPKMKPGTTEWPALVDLTGTAETIDISKPFGTDTYILLTTADQLSDLSVFNFEGALSRGLSDAATNPLATLLQNSSAGTRGFGTSVPANWSVQYTPIQSESKSAASQPQP